MWLPDTWGTAEETPDLIDIVEAQFGPDTGATREMLEASYVADLVAD
jgi:hypothetical protein